MKRSVRDLQFSQRLAVIKQNMAFEPAKDKRPKRRAIIVANYIIASGDSSIALKIKKTKRGYLA